MFTRLKTVASNLHHELKVYRLILADKRTPKLPELLLAMALAYLALPFDLVPDFIPGIGHLDDLVIVPGLIILALKMVPQEIINDSRARAETDHRQIA